MKTLQNDLTTIEQSNKLLELGVPKDSANHYYGKDGKIHYIDGTIPYSLLWATGCAPCWSVGRLFEIAWICGKYYSDFIKGACRCFLLTINSGIPITDDIIAILFKKNTLDFSKLEE